MSNANRSWDGSQLVGSISGFSDISTGVAAEPQQVNVIAPSDLLNRIERMQHFLQLPEVDHAIRVIYDHIDKKGNPHRTTLDQFVNQITDVLYAELLDNLFIVTKLILMLIMNLWKRCFQVLLLILNQHFH